MKILIVGALCKRGLLFIRELDEDCYVVVIDNLDKKGKNLMELLAIRKVKFYHYKKWDSDTIKKVMKKEKIKVVFYF